ncbi:MAG TPA: alpha-1,4-glucan--maltose-1-phosphate maltosyltransferase [Solirubrobacteraceae bacterium]|nr:alpha-1,4-glucan--maltose-1-phosphate maltosyltransferase [Solirubrobacteraceae bacterium]
MCSWTPLVRGSRIREERGFVPARAKANPPSRIRIEHPAPTIDCGRWPVKRTVGDTVHVSADIFRDGHEVLRAVVRWRAPGETTWRESPLTAVDAHHDGVRWEGAFTVEAPGRTQWTIQAWVDLFEGWRDELARKVEFGQPDLSGELSEGAVLLRAAAERADGEPSRALAAAADAIATDPRAALAPELLALVEDAQERTEATELDTPLEIDVDRTLARFGAWYELFPRSFGGFRGVKEQLPRLAELGFDVLYMPPIHPIGHTNRKGRNNTLTPEPGDPGSPYAIGDETGGHDAIHPELGSDEDFRALVAAANERGIEVCLDLAINCSPDHPWLKEHPEWFFRRPDGTLKYAENPPKKYQDIYNVNFGSEDWRGLWDALLGVVRHWVDRGVTVFRVDNPHTKPFVFWEWLIKEIRATNPEVVFLAEAFTRRAVMRELAKIGFSQSYTYFTWKNARWELAEYLSELARGEEAEYFRPNFFVNTPDILTDYLADGGPPAFPIRLILAATLSPSYGIYSGFEHYEHVQRPGSEEYIDNEKYEIKHRALDGPLLPLAQRLNHIRRENPALQRLENLVFLDAANEAILAYAKREGPNALITVVNLDPHHAQEGLVHVPYELGVPPAFAVDDLLDGGAYTWRLGGNYVRLDPAERAGHVLRVRTA